jgi:hypothetical protein
MFGVLFLSLLVSSYRCLDAPFFDHFQHFEAEDFEQLQGEKASIPDHVDPMLFQLTFDTCMHLN